MLKKEMKKRIKAGLNKKDLHCFEFTESTYQSITWEKENKEFALRNSFYDVVKLEKLPNGNIKLYCIDDKQESKLFAKLDSEVQKYTDIEKNGTAGAKKILKLIKVQASLLEPNENNVLVGTSIPTKEYQYPTSSLTKIIQTPPPQIVC